MSEKVQIAWVFFPGKVEGVYAVCHECQNGRLPRDEYWVNIAPKRYFSFDQLKKRMKGGAVPITCDRGHRFWVTEFRFAPRNRKKPSNC